MSFDCDVCVIGSGAGGGPVALSLARAGYRVIVVEKGPWYTEKDFFKDEIAECRRNKFSPLAKHEPQVVETRFQGTWTASPTYVNGWNFWNGNMVGGATNIMSGFFHRLKPEDFRLLSEFGPIEGAMIEDWPIGYEDLEPYYELVEREVGISGRVVPHPDQEPRSTPDFPYPPTAEHPLAHWIDEVAYSMDLHPLPLPRAVLSKADRGRGACSYSGYCGNYGCATGAKGSSRAALLDRAVETGRCEIRARCSARRIESDASGRATALEYHDWKGDTHCLHARIFVVACQAIETARLLLLSTGQRHPNGLANGNGLVGMNLLFSPNASAEAAFPYAAFPAAKADELRSHQPFINRYFDDWYFIREGMKGARTRKKGGVLDFMFVHPNPIGLGSYFAFSSDKKMVWGEQFKRKLFQYIHDARHVMCEIFCDWLPVPDCRVTLDPEVKDIWGLPVARVRVHSHPRHKEIGRFLAERAAEILDRVGGQQIEIQAHGMPATNLVAGTCRFGRDPKKSVLDRDCRAHEVENLFISDGSFMPTGGSVPYTWTIYANSFRVADKIIEELGGERLLRSGEEDRSLSTHSEFCLRHANGRASAGLLPK